MTFSFEAHFSRRVEARSDGSAMTTDGRAWLLHAVDQKIQLWKRAVACFTDGRDLRCVEHALAASAHPFAGGLRLLPRGTDGLV